MSTASHYPDAGYYANSDHQQTTLTEAAEPGTLANWQGFTALSSGDLTHLGTDDTNGVQIDSYGVGGPPTYYAGGCAARLTMSGGTLTQLDFTVKGQDTGGTSYNLWAYNFHTAAFASIGSHSGEIGRAHV